MAEGWLSAASTKCEFNIKSRIYVHRKWNVLSKMVIPRVKLSCSYITSELEEIEREDNFRLKRFKELKIKKQMAKNAANIKPIQPIPEENSDSCPCNIEIPVTDKESICSLYNEEKTEIEDVKRHTERIDIISQKDFSGIQSKKSNEQKISPEEDKFICDLCKAKYSKDENKDSKISEDNTENQVDNDKSEIKIIDQNKSVPDSKTISSKHEINSRDNINLEEKDTVGMCKYCQADSNVSLPRTKHKEIEVICPTCNTRILTSTNEGTSSCADMKRGTDDNFSPASENPETNLKSICSCSQLANVELPKDKDNKLASSDKCCVINSKESKLKIKEKKNSCVSICKRDERIPQDGNKSQQRIIKSVKEIIIRKTPDSDGNITLQKRIVTTINEKRINLSKCCSESDMYQKPSYAGSNTTIKTSKSNLKSKCSQMSVLKSRGNDSTELSKVSGSAACSDVNKNDQELQNKSNNSMSQSASVASVDYSCSDKTISACHTCSESEAPEEDKTTQICPECSNETQTEKEKPKPSYCTIKIFAKADSNVPIDESNNIELTPSALDLLRKILLQATKSSANSESSNLPTTPKCNCSTKSSEPLKQKSVCSTNLDEITNEINDGESTQDSSCLDKPEENTKDSCCRDKPEEDTQDGCCSDKREDNTQDSLCLEQTEENIEDKEETPKKCICSKTNEGVQFLPSEPESFEIGGRQMKNVYTETISISPKLSRSELIKKHSCITKVDAPIVKNSIIKKETSVCSCQSKKKENNTELKCSCSKSQKAPEQKPCNCSKSESQEGKCNCNRKQETIKTCSCKVPKPCNCKVPKICTCKSKTIPDPKSDNKCQIPNTDSKNVESSSDSKICSKCASTNDAYASTKDKSTQKESVDSMSKYSCCSQDKPVKPIPDIHHSICSVCGKKDASTSTRRSDRYDVRPLRLLFPSKKEPCPCLSDSVMLKNKHSKIAILKRCSSYGDSHY